MSITASIYVLQGAMLFHEADAFLVDHLSDRPYLSKILSPHRIDAEDYMARPVSHFFENIDAYCFYLFYLLEIPLFISVTKVVMLIILSAVIWFCAINYANVPPSITTLMLALLWTNPNVFFASSLYRDAKMAATFFFILTGLYSLRLIWFKQSCQILDFLIIFILALLACLSDPQGAAVIAMLTSIVLVWALVTSSKAAYISCVSGLCAFLTYLGSVDIHFNQRYIAATNTNDKYDDANLS